MKQKHALHNMLLLIAVFGLLLAACAPAATEVPPAAEPTAAAAEPTAAAAEPTAAAAEPTAAPAEPTAVPEPCPDGLQAITFQAGFLPQGNISFVAAYVAKEKGYFEDVCLDVTIEHSSPGSGEQWQRLAGKDIEFTTDPGESFVNRMNGTPDLPFISVTVLGHEGDHGLMVLADSGINTIADLKGLTVGYKGSETVPPWLLAMLDAEGLSIDDVKVVQVGFDPRVLLPDYGEGRVDALQVFKSNEPDTMQRAGVDVVVFKPEDYGVHFLGQTYVTHTDFVRDDPEMVRNFVRATMKGLAFALDAANKDEVTDIVMIYAGADADREHNEFIWQTEIQYVQAASTDEVGLGWASDDEWNTMMDYMVSFGSLEERFPVASVWDGQFVRSIYEGG